MSRSFQIATTEVSDLSVQEAESVNYILNGSWQINEVVKRKSTLFKIFTATDSRIKNCVEAIILCNDNIHKKFDCFESH